MPMLNNDAGFEVRFRDVGATITSIRLPLANSVQECVLWYEDDRGWETDRWFLGSTVGRYANRIAGAAFSLDGNEFHVDRNEGNNCLHGGVGGFHRRHFEFENDGDALVARMDSPDGDQGFPGRLAVAVRFCIVGRFALRIDYEAISDAPTVVNMTSHPYFNLGGDVASHRLRLFADEITAVNDRLLPSGEFAAVDGGDLDFRSGRAIGDTVLDNNFVLRPSDGLPRVAAQLRSAATGVGLRILTTQPGLQVYTGDSLGEPFGPRAGIALEPQNFPDAPNQAAFPDATLRPGERYRQTTIYEFLP